MTEKRGRGRPTKFNQEIAERIVTYIKGGSYVETAAAAAGIDKTTLYDWLKRGANGDARYEEFSHAVERALGQGEMRDLMIVDKAAQDGVWQAAAWKLERRSPSRWGRREHVELSGRDGSAIEIDCSGLRDEIARRIAGIASRTRTEEDPRESD